MDQIQALLQKLRDFMGVTAKADRLPDPTPEMILSHLTDDKQDEFEWMRDTLWNNQFRNQMPQVLQRQLTAKPSAFNMPEITYPAWGARDMPSYNPGETHIIKPPQTNFEFGPGNYERPFPTRGANPIYTPDSAEDLVSKIIDNPRGEP